jgi:transaldolase
MQFFLDTASLDDIRRWQTLGLVEGVTTNPALLAREGGDPLEQLRSVAELVRGPVSAQVTETEPQAMIRQGRALSELAPNIVVKVPATESGYGAAAELARVGVSCNITLTFQPAQAIPFARIPVAYVSLIIGRKDDFGLDSLEEITRARQMLDRLATPTRLLVASIRNPHHLCAAVTGGADVITVPPSTWKLVYENPLSVQGLEDFASAWSGLSPEVRAEYERLGKASAA